MLFFMSFILFSLFFVANKHLKFSLNSAEGSFSIASSQVLSPLDNKSLLRGFGEWLGIIPIKEPLGITITLDSLTKKINYKEGKPFSQEWLFLTKEISLYEEPILLSSGKFPLTENINPYELKEWFLSSWFIEEDQKEIYHIYQKSYKGILEGFLGESLTYQKPITNLIGEKLPITLLIGFLTFLFSYPLAIPLGYLLSNSKGKIGNHLKSFFYFIFSLPNILLGIFLLWFFSWKLKLFPIQTLPWWLLEEDPKSFFLSLINPILTLGIPLLITNSLTISKRLEESYYEPFLLYAKAKGLSSFQIAKTHLLKISLAPLISQSKQIFVLLISGSLVVEHIFGIAGMGNLSLNALLNSDLMLALSLALLIGTMQIIGQLTMEGIFSLCYPYSEE